MKADFFFYIWAYKWLKMFYTAVKTTMEEPYRYDTVNLFWQYEIMILITVST